MRLKRLTTQGITRFDREVDLDFEAMPEGVIAIAGPNGAGKTTLLELSGPASLFRELPTRSPGGVLSSWVGDDGGRVRLVFELGGREYEAEVLVDKKGSMTAFLKEDGVSLVSGKVRDYDAKIGELVGTKESFLVSVFGAQGGKGRFSSLSVAERKKVFRYYLGLERMAQVHRVASDTLRAIERGGLDISEVEEEIEALERARDQFDDDEKEASERTEALSKRIAQAREEFEEKAKLAGVGELFTVYDAALDEVNEAFDMLESAKEEVSPPPKGEEPDAEEARSRFEEARDKEASLSDESERLLMEGEALKSRLDEYEGRSSLLSEVPCEGRGDFSKCPLLSDAASAKAKLPELRDRVSACGDRFVGVKETLSIAREKSAEAREEFSSAQERAEAWREQHEQNKRTTREVEVWEQRKRDATSRALTLREKLPKDEGRGLPSPESVEALRNDLRGFEAQHSQAVREHAQAKASKESTEERLSEQREKLSGLMEEVKRTSALRLLVGALGSNGIQAFEIDAAGPRVSELANDLLRSCYGSRFTVEFQTLKEKKSGGFKEDFSLKVVDSERGPDRDVSGLSGGEQVVVDEALRTALSLFAAERASLPIETLWRDETVGALDGDNSARYVRMLHRARTLGGFQRVVYVTHDEKAIESADAIIRVGADGSVRVEG